MLVSTVVYLQAKRFLSTREPATLGSLHLDVDHMHMLLDDIIAACSCGTLTKVLLLLRLDLDMCDCPTHCEQ